jgi:lysophospholipase L1-like esterase
LGAFGAAFTLAGRGASAGSTFSETKDFELLVIGDSLIWGQGLLEEQKFYHLTREWLEREAFGGRRRVNLTNKSHSGASINLRPYEIQALDKAEISEAEFFHREVNLSFPSIRAQLGAARKLYENPAAVDLIMLSGGVTDVRLTTILNPLKDNDELRREIERHCGEEMFRLLEDAAARFPKALIAVVGYYPFLSRQTPSSVIFNNLLEMYEVAPPLKALINNPLNRSLLGHYRRKMVERSLIWWRDSTREYQKAVARLNEKFDRPRAVFVRSPITEENSMGTKNPLLYEVGKKGRAADARAAERKAVCKPTLDQLREQTDLKFRARTCELATVGHPTPEGARLYAAAIQKSLKPFFQSEA